MRIKITFKLPDSRQVLPLNYQYPLSAWIYRVLQTNDSKFSDFLHEVGFRLENQKVFKLFTFSNLKFPVGSWRILKGTDRMEIFSSEASLIVSIMIPEVMENFVAGLFKDQKAEIGDRISTVEMEVRLVEMLEEPFPSDKETFRALSPIVVTQDAETQKQEIYLKPGQEGYDHLFFKNLIDKHHAWQRQMQKPETQFNNNEMHFRCLTEKPKSRLQTIKAFSDAEVKVRGYLFEFEIVAPPELIQTGLESGFGAMNALGFGCGEVVGYLNP